MLGLLLDLALLLSPIVFFFSNFSIATGISQGTYQTTCHKNPYCAWFSPNCTLLNHDPCTCTGCTGEWTTNTAAAGCAAATS
jgi:hypothetical protein